VEHLRQTMPKSLGSMYWQYNDCWPGVSWSSIDYYGRWKALQYLARHFYAPLMVSAVEDAEKCTVDVFVTSDRLQATQGAVHWNITNPAGRSFTRDFVNVEIPARRSQKIGQLDLRGLVQANGANELLVWLKLVVDGQTVSENFATLVPPKDLKLLRPSIKTSVREGEHGFGVTLAADNPALWTWLESAKSDARLSDNFVHLQPDSPLEIMVSLDQPMPKAQFIESLRVRSLHDTYSVS
jgi:beta-mannosidase